MQGLGDQGWVVSKPGQTSGGMRVDQVDGTTWVVQAAGGDRRRIRQIGPAGLRTALLIDEEAARATMSRLQKRLGAYLANEQIAWTLRSLHVNCVLDVGANTGQYGQRLRALGYTGRIVSFEPLGHLVKPLRESASQDPDWRVFDCGLGDEDALAEINVVPGKLSSMLPSSDFGKDWSDKLQDMHQETVQIRRLDSVFDEAIEGLAEPRVYLKMDTQGYDLQTFRGAGPRIEAVLGMQSEVSCVPIYEGMPRMAEQLTEYESAGFEVAGMFPVSRHHETLRVIEFDVVMVRAQAVSDAAHLDTI